MNRVSQGQGIQAVLLAALCLALLSTRLVSAAALPGTLTITGNNFTYNVPGEKNMSGILHKPTGDGPFPAVVISHGFNGSSTGFSRTKALEMITWGYVCIGALYTHSPDDPDYPNDAGASPENMRRAKACLDILQSLSYVDSERLCAYGNSMGAFISIHLADEETQRVQVAAITAGGISTSSEADAIVAPFLMLHGANDGTVSPSMSALLETVLTGNGVTNRRVLYPGVAHQLHSDRATEVYAEIRSWFEQYNIPTPPAAVKSWERY